MKTEERTWVRAAALGDVQDKGCVVVTLNGHAVALFAHDGGIHAVDNRCPHMGFPLHRGSVRDGILTCHWHHARFDLATGGTFDLFADNVRSFPVEVRDADVWVDVAPRGDLVAHHRRRLREGLEHGIPLVIGKAVLTLIDAGEDPAEPFRIGLDFGVRQREAGWGQGLTMHTCLMNLLPLLDAQDRPRALYHGLGAVARETAGSPTRFMLEPLPGSRTDMPTLTRWLRRFVEVRDSEGAERCIVTAVQAGAGAGEMSRMLFAAITDHRYIDIGHVADFANKALESLQIAGWEHAAPVLSSLAGAMTRASRMEESNAWRHPVDLVEILEAAFEKLPDAVEAPRRANAGIHSLQELTDVLLGEDPAASVESLLDALRDGTAPDEVSAAVAYAAARRIAHFHISNEFSDWDTALHTFTFANAMHQAVRRSPDALTMRGVFDAAMSVYLDRFLNVPPTALPAPGPDGVDPGEVLRELPPLLDRQQQVNQAGAAVARYLRAGGDPSRMVGMLGTLLLREDRDFHTIQTVEAAVRLHACLPAQAGADVLVAAARYLAAHAPTSRSQGQTYQIAWRLHRGERVYEDD